MSQINRIGFGQVEPNHLSAQRNGKIYAQLPAEDSINILENGQFVKYHYAAGVCDFSKDEDAGEWMLVFNEVKLYDDRWRESYKDFALQKDRFTTDHYYLTLEDMENDENRQHVYHEGSGVGPLKGQMVPRVFKTDIGDIYSTNCVKAQGAQKVLTEGIDVEEKTLLYVNDEGFLDVSGDENGPVWAVVKVYTMPDGQPGIKVQRVK